MNNVGNARLKLCWHCWTCLSSTLRRIRGNVTLMAVLMLMLMLILRTVTQLHVFPDVAIVPLASGLQSL